jgi:hypothetical protein
MSAQLAVDPHVGSSTYTKYRECLLNILVHPCNSKGGVQPYYAANTHSILLTSTLHRTQSQNVDDCLSKVCT